MKYHIISTMYMADGSVEIYFGFVEFLTTLLFIRKHVDGWEVRWHRGNDEE